MNRLAELREKRNMTQEQLANALGMSTSAIAMYETNKRIPTLKRAKKIAEFFGVPIEYIFFKINTHEMRANNPPAAAEG